MGGAGIVTGGVGPDWMVTVGGASVNTIWLPTSVRMVRICGSGEGSGGGAMALHSEPRM